MSRDESERFNYVRANRWRGGRCETDDRDSRVGEAKMRQVKIGWAKVVTPFGDTVSLINSDTRKLSLIVNDFKSSTKCIGKY